MFSDARKIELQAGPLEVLSRWPAHLPVAFLHSGRLNGDWSRYSVIAQPQAYLAHQNGRTTWSTPAHPQRPVWTNDPLFDLELATQDDQALYLGYLGYEIGHRLEPTTGTPSKTAREWPDLLMHRCPRAWVFDHLNKSWSFVDADNGSTRLPPGADGNGPPDTRGFRSSNPISDDTRLAHESRVRRALEYIAAGDVFQVNLAQRFRAKFEGSPRALFAALAAVSPAWYGAYVELPTENGDPPRALASTSPELFLKLDADGTVTTRPIKGTRPAAAADPAAADELRDSAKDAAELNMIIDLLRNDLGRVCGYGSVKVTQARTIETHPTVHHGVATITGQLHPDQKLRHLLRATFPGGSITGAPKIRAMQIIRELEAGPRGPYCGAIGLVRGGPSGVTANRSIAIRTLLVDPAAERVRFHVGGGIVADSDPAAEYEETLHKAEALRRALAGGSR